MSASFPTSVKSFSANQDGVTEVDAAFADARDDEIEAIEGALLTVITPAQITANQNNYEPTGWAGAALVRLSSDASRDITGFAALTHGLPKTLHNIGAQNIILKDASGSSSAANRMALTGDITMTPDSVVVIQYDVISAVFRVVSGGGGAVAASAVTYDNVTSGLTATDVQAAIDEVEALVGGGGYTDEMAQDAIGAMVDTSLVYVDATPLLTRAALTGDVTASQGGNATTIANDAVTNAKAANMVESTVKGRAAGAGTGDPTDLTAAQVRTILALKTLATLFPLGNEPPATIYATLDTRNAHPVLDFDGAADEEAVWTVKLPDWYGGGGLTVDTFWAFTSATSGSLRVQAAIERINLSSLDIDADSFAAFQSAGGSAPGTSGQVIKVTVAFTDGAQMDSVAAGELFRLKVRRDADGTSGTDDIATDAELLAVVVKET